MNIRNVTSEILQTRKNLYVNSLTDDARNKVLVTIPVLLIVTMEIISKYTHSHFCRLRFPNSSFLFFQFSKNLPGNEKNLKNFF